MSDQEPSPVEQPPPPSTDETPPFQPFFTLLTNNTTNATVHPHVHYLFSDDDTSVLAAPRTSHRTLIVDLAAPTGGGGWSVSWASSLSPDFAVTGSHISPQQHDGDGASLMLCVEGVEREPVDSASLPGSSLLNASGPPAVRDEAEGLAEDFKRRMGVLKRVIAEGERRREVMAQGGEDANETT